MDFGWDQELNRDRVEVYERDGDAARLVGWWHEPPGRARRSATHVGNTVRRALGDAATGARMLIGLIDGTGAAQMGRADASVQRALRSTATSTGGRTGERSGARIESVRRGG